MTERIIIDVDSGVMSITLNRPEALNALENTMIRAINEALDQAAKDATIRAVLFQGAGKAFCAGDDLKSMGTDSDPEPADLHIRYAEGYPSIVKRILALEKPVVTSLKRFALGAGLEIALASDIIVAEKSARIGLPFVLRGIASGTTLLQRMAPEHLARRLLFLGDLVHVHEIESLGLFARTVDGETDDVDQAAMEVALSLSNSATRAIGLMKTALNDGRSTSIDSAMRIQVGATASSVLTEDFIEGREAFEQKRDPEFGGR